LATPDCGHSRITYEYNPNEKGNGLKN